MMGLITCTIGITVATVLLAFLFNTNNVFAFSILQTGTWSIHANGYNGILKITSVDNQGNVKGTMTNTTEKGETKILGFYDPLLQKIQLNRILDSNPLSVQHYTGFLFKEASFGIPGISDTMTGYFLGNGVNEGGWFAIKQLG
jgi:hypothetical protein